MKTIDDLISVMESRRVNVKEVRNNTDSVLVKSLAVDVVYMLDNLIDMAKEIKDNEK